MKNILRLLSFSIFVLGLNSCKKAENKDFFEGGTPPALSASTAAVTLEPGLESNTALVLNWTNPNFMFSTGISSQDVAYSVEIDTVGGNFKSSNKKIISIPKEQTMTFTVGALNAILGNDMLLQLNPRRNYSLQIRVMATITGITNPSVMLASNVVPLAAKPFAPPPKVQPPPTGFLYLVGSATPGGDAHGWDNPVPTPSQQFSKISNTQYELTIPLIGGKEYLFLPLNGDWTNKYACAKEATQALDGGEFGYNGGNGAFNDNFPAPAASGTYKITVNFQLGKYTVVKQ